MTVVLIGTSCEHEIVANFDQPVILEPCDPAIINYDLDVQPVLTSHCAIPGCHDNQTPAVFIDLSTYDAVMESEVLGELIVKPGDPANSKLWRAMKALDLIPMPPPFNYQVLGADQQKIRQWIEQGAQRLEPCVDITCDTTRFDWSTTIRPIMNRYCRGCHYKDYPAADINLDFHSQVQEEALNGLLYESVAGIAPARLMPLDKPMPDCQIIQIRKWVEAGAPQD